jgi:hypothetical protein
MGKRYELGWRPRGLLLPGLDPEALYVARLSSRSALYSELRLLIEGLARPLASPKYRCLVMEQNRLARASSSARLKLWEQLHARYRLDREDPAFAAFWVEWSRSRSEPERSLVAYVLFALNDRLVTDLGTEWLFPLLRRAPAEVRVENVQAFLRRAEARHPEVAAWSAATRLAWAQKYCASIRDFGLAEGVVRKRTVRPALYAAPVRLLAWAVRLAGASSLELVQSRIFRLLGIDSNEVIDALGELNRLGALHFRIQGDVIELALDEEVA